MKNPNFWIVDAFVGQMPERWARGNPAAVVFLDAFAADEILAEIANEMNFSETAFLVSRGNGDFQLRWFTPVEEVDLCGHATLASAVALLDDQGNSELSTFRFATRSGVLTAKGSSVGVELDFPVQSVVPCQIPQGVIRSLGWETGKIHWQGYEADDDWLIEVGESIIGGCSLDFGLLAHVSREQGKRGVILTGEAKGNKKFDFVSRFFAPALGIDEDAVTGSAHTKLAPFWGEKLGKTSLRALQLSPRGGVIEMEWQGERVILRGQGQIRVRGDLLL